MPALAAQIPATDDGLLRGDGIFEAIRIYQGRPFALDEHLARLERSGASLRLPFDVAAISADVATILAAAGARDCLLRIVVTRGGRRLLLTEPLAAVVRLPQLRLRTVTYESTLVLSGIKSLSYAANMLAGRLAREQGFDEALLTTAAGEILEAPTASLFWISGDAVYTPPLDHHILASITRAHVIALSDAQERVCTVDDLALADEVFLASTLVEVKPVGGVDQLQFTAPGPRTAVIASDLRAEIETELAAAAAAG